MQMIEGVVVHVFSKQNDFRQQQ